jgi:hypothetical protein
VSLAEKFQITVPFKQDESEGWATVESVRINEGVTTPEHGAKFNRMPVVQAPTARDHFVHGFGGDTDVSGSNINPESLEVGYQRKELKATDDQYSGEHVDLFYGEVKDENGKASFVERNNYLDRM